VKKIALALVAVSALGLAACGETASTNATVDNAMDAANAAAEDMQNAAAEMTDAAGNVADAATNAADAAGDAAANAGDAAANEVK
jgi:hypothetical protein